MTMRRTSCIPVNHSLVMGLSKKRKQHLAQITALATESKKTRKFDVQSQQEKRFLRKQREEDFLDEHEDFQSDLSSDESRFDESSLDREGTDEEDSEVDEEDLGVDDERGDNTQEGLGDNDGRVQLEDKDPISGQFGRIMQVGIYEE